MPIICKYSNKLRLDSDFIGYTWSQKIIFPIWNGLVRVGKDYLYLVRKHSSVLTCVHLSVSFILSINMMSVSVSVNEHISKIVRVKESLSVKYVYGYEYECECAYE